MKLPRVTIIPEISVGAIVAIISTLGTIVWMVATISADVQANTQARMAGILPEAERRVSVLETAFTIQMKSLTEAINGLKEEIRELRSERRANGLKMPGGISGPPGKSQGWEAVDEPPIH